MAHIVYLVQSLIVFGFCVGPQALENSFIHSINLTIA